MYLEGLNVLFLYEKFVCILIKGVSSPLTRFMFFIALCIDKIRILSRYFRKYVKNGAVILCRHLSSSVIFLTLTFSLVHENSDVFKRSFVFWGINYIKMLKFFQK